MDYTGGFSNFVAFANLINYILITISIVIIFFIFLLSIMTIFLLIYYQSYDSIKKILNYNFIYLTSYQYNFFNIRLCTDTDYSQDILYIFIQEYLNLILFYIYFIIILVIIILLIIFALLLFLDLIIAANNENHIWFTSGTFTNLNKTYLIFLLILIIYSIINFVIFTYSFIIDTVGNYILTYNSYFEMDIFIYELLFKKNSNNQYIYDYNYYNALKTNDIDTINSIFDIIIKNDDKDNCLTKYLHIYNFYKYFHNYIPTNIKIYNDAVDNYLTCGKDQNKITFYSLLMMESKVIMKIDFSNLNFYNNINDYTESQEILITNAFTQIGTDINLINKFIINAKSPLEPYNYLLKYIFIMFFINLIILIIIIYIISYSTSDDFNIYIITFANYLTNNINSLFSNYKEVE